MKQKSPRKQSQLKSFAVAFHGLKTVFVNERNFRIHLSIGIITIIACSLFNVSTVEWAIVLMLIALVLCAEILNTGIEYLCNYVAPEYQPMIKTIKDVSAAAVLLCAIFAAIIGCLIFIPYLIS